ncbi:MAG: cysteine desulfurase family protein [Minisyncoccia bacterium]
MWFSGTKKRTIYLDYASATPILPEAARVVRDAMHLFGNPGAIHADGVAASRSLENSRERIAAELAVKPREIIFTSGGTEGNNIAILGTARKLALSGVDLSTTHWVVSSIEHPSVLEAFGEIERLGGVVTHIDPDVQGVISVETVRAALKAQTVLISIGWANSETGVVQPLRDIARAVHEESASIRIHSDAGQAPLYLSPQVHTLGVDMMSFDSGKFYGPRGVGALFISNRTELAPVILGGGQERGLRAGTENVALAAGFAESFARIASERESESHRLCALRNQLFFALKKALPSLVVNGEAKRMLPHILNVSVPHMQSEYVTLSLDAKGISISTKSACREGKNRRSHVVAMLAAAAREAEKGESADWRAENTLRFSLGRDTRAPDLERVVRELMQVITQNKT